MSDGVVLVTGSTTGIGRGIAEHLARTGWKVVVSGRRKKEGDAVVAGIRSEGGEAVFIEADLGSKEAIDELHKKAIATWGRLDAAVNNAGINNDQAKFADLNGEKFQQMIDINVLAVFWSMQLQIKHMLQQKGGRIVNIASTAGQRSTILSGSYAATEHAVIGMTKTAGVEYAAEGICINAVAPGCVKTQFLDQALSLGWSEETIRDLFPIKRLAEPLDIAKAVKFLLDSPYAVGSVVTVDGGHCS
ncbi:short chain dehydrogenase [Thelonectria olida]|uniref:3-oxoacyl-[acyl-carrier-protein] reductase n=1 Tax=Thelonectria olida TaxID=1576542 RepID=A0A9P9AHM8_9HYPO|nr:short chain dehydrogenase [Thelonectria olida]